MNGGCNEVENGMQVALIGVGMVARTHVAAIAAMGKKVQLRGVLSRDPIRTTAFAKKVGEQFGSTPQVYENVAAIAADPAIDFVVLCTPPNARAEIVTALAKAGKPILMEKPIERSHAAALEIVETCETAGVPLGIVFQHRKRAAAELLSTRLKSGVFGKPHLIEVSVPWWREQSYYQEPGRGTYARDGGGVLISQAIHTLDLALSMTAPVVKVQALASTTGLHTMESEDFVTAGLVFEDGMIGSVVASTASYPGDAETIKIHCEKASAMLRAAQLEISWRDGGVEVIGDAGGTGGGADPMAFTHEWHQAIIEDFADAITQNRAPIASGRVSLAVHKVIDAMVASSRQESAIHLNPSET